MINIIYLSNDYYLVIFSHDDDHNVAIMGGPWFIYDQGHEEQRIDELTDKNKNNCGVI